MLWDTRETLSTHHQVTEEGVASVSRSPTFTTTQSHSTRVTSIRHLGTGLHTQDMLTQQQQATTQLLSLELSGQVVVWTVLDTQRDYDQHLGLAHWGQVGRQYSQCLV